MDSDQALIRRIRLGEEKAFDELVRKYYDDIYGYCRCHCRTVEMAEDITQDTFLHFFGALSSYRHCGKLKNMLLTIARNLICNEYAKKREEPTEQSFLEVEENKVTRICLSETERTELQMEVEQALNLLPDRLRQVIISYYFQGYSLSEISDKENFSLSNAKYLLVKARRELRKIFEKTEHE